MSEEFLGIELKQYGLRPREWRGIKGIASMHFLHSDWNHILNNSISFLVLNTMLFFYYRKVSFRVLFTLMFVGGILLWLGGRSSNHIGASLVIFGEAAFLFFSGLFSRSPMMLRIGLVVAFYYGSMIWGVFPIDPSVSWEGHLSGAIVGIVMAWIHKDKVPPRKKYSFELEEEYEKVWAQLEDHQLPVREVEEIKMDQKPEQRIIYHFKSKKD